MHTPVYLSHLCASVSESIDYIYIQSEVVASYLLNQAGKGVDTSPVRLITV